MSSTSNNVDRRPDREAPAHEYFEVVWRTSSGGAWRRAGSAAWEVIGIAVGLRSADEVQPNAIEIRECDGPLVVRFAYGDDRELARRHAALVERRLWSRTVGSSSPSSGRRPRPRRRDPGHRSCRSRTARGQAPGRTTGPRWSSAPDAPADRARLIRSLARGLPPPTGAAPCEYRQGGAVTGALP
ncbi:hypothetical protein N7U49_38355 [Streptomyces sp. AD2-2]|nr:hypothetical protein N7U49_38355 [Streptomyces sp. AD2-2]